MLETTFIDRLCVVKSIRGGRERSFAAVNYFYELPFQALAIVI